MTLLAVATAFLLGVFLGDRLDPPVSAVLLLTSGALLVGLFLRRIGQPVLPAVLALFVVIGCLRTAVMTDTTANLAGYHTLSSIQVEGLALDDAGPVGTALRFPVRVERLLTDDGWVEVEGTALVTAGRSVEVGERRDPPHIRYGDRLLLEGPLTAPPELDDFDYPAYLARQGIGSVMSFPSVTILGEGEGGRLRSALFGVRRRLHASLGRATPEPEASIGQALLIGMRDTIPDAVVGDFRATGTSHLLAISGLHVGILMALALPVSARIFGRRRGLYLIVPLAAVWLYAVLAGLSPSVVRASIMGTVYLAALALGRPKSILPALGLAATVMVAVSPNILWSVSFQLSFAAMAGIATLSDPVSYRLQGLLGVLDEEGAAYHLPVRAVAGAVGTSAAAILATMPLTAFHFQQVSLVGLPTTLVTLPMASLRVGLSRPCRHRRHCVPAARNGVRLACLGRDDVHRTGRPPSREAPRRVVRDWSHRPRACAGLLWRGGGMVRRATERYSCKPRTACRTTCSGTPWILCHEVARGSSGLGRSAHLDGGAVRR